MANSQTQYSNGGHNYYLFTGNTELAYANLVRVLADMEASLVTNAPNAAQPLLLVDNVNNTESPTSISSTTSPLELEAQVQVNNNDYESDKVETNVTSSTDTINCAADNTVPVVLAKPGEITEYFQCISAHLVKNQVNEIAFAKLKANIDHLLVQAQQWPEKENQSPSKTTHIEIMY